MDTSKAATNSDGSASYEEAITLTGYGKFNYLVTIVGGFSLMIALMAQVDVIYILPASECELKLTKKDRGVLSGAYFIGVIVSSHLLGFLSDTLGRRYVIIRALYINIIIYILASISPNYWFFLVIRFLTGVVLCGVFTCGLVYVTEFHSNKYRAQAVMVLSSIASIAFIYCPCLGWLILPQQWSISLLGIIKLTPWRLYYVLLGSVPSVIIGTIMFYLPESPKYLLACSKTADALEILKRVYVFNTGNQEEQYPVKSLLQNPNEQVSQLAGNSKTPAAVIQMIWNQTYPLFMPPHLLNMLLSCCILFSVFYSFSGILIWIPDISNQLIILKDDFTSGPKHFCQVVESNWTANIERSNSLESISTVSTANPSPVVGDTICKNTLKNSIFTLNLMIGAILVVSIFLSTFIIPRVNRKAFVSLLCLAIIGIYLLLLELPNVYIMIVCLAMTIIILNIIFYSTTTLLVDYFPTNYRAMAVCLAVMSGRLGSAVGGEIFSLFLLENCRNMFYTAGGILFLAFTSCISLQAPKTNKTTANRNSLST